MFFFWNIIHVIEKIQKWTSKNKKIEIRARHTNSMLIEVQKDICVQEILLLEVWFMEWGGGSKLKVQGTNSYPVNECIYNYIYILN